MKWLLSCEWIPPRHDSNLVQVVNLWLDIIFWRHRIVAVGIPIRDFKRHFFVLSSSTAASSSLVCHIPNAVSIRQIYTFAFITFLHDFLSIWKVPKHLSLTLPSSRPCRDMYGYLTHKYLNMPFLWTLREERWTYFLDFGPHDLFLFKYWCCCFSFFFASFRPRFSYAATLLLSPHPTPKIRLGFVILGTRWISFLEPFFCVVVFAVRICRLSKCFWLA